MLSTDHAREWENIAELELPHGLWDMLHLFHSDKDEKHHKLEKEVSTDVRHILENSKKKLSIAWWDKKRKIPLNHTTWMTLRHALGFRSIKKMHSEKVDMSAIKNEALSAKIDYHALWKTVVKILWDKRIANQLGVVITEMMKPFLAVLSTTEGGGKLIFQMIHDKMLTWADKETLVKLMPTFAKSNWGGFIIKEMALQNILSLEDKPSITWLLPDLNTTPSGKTAMSALEKRKIFKKGEIKTILLGIAA